MSCFLIKWGEGEYDECPSPGASLSKFAGLNAPNTIANQQITISMASSFRLAILKLIRKNFEIKKREMV